MTCKDLRKVSDLGREALLGTVQSSGDSEIDRGLFEATVKEVEKGFIEGPVGRESLPAGSTLTKRFPVKQKNKVRPIDDYKASLVNYAVTQTEGVTIHTIDHIADTMTAWWLAVLAAVKSWHGFLKSRKVVLFTDSESVRGSFLKTWSANDNSDDMISFIFEVEEGFDIPLWIERVPSQSNPSDVLSREVVAVFEGAERVRVNPREIWKSLVK